MRRVGVVLAALMLPVRTGEIFGDVRVGDQYVAQAPVQLVCGADTSRGRTDDAGSFRLTSKGSGKCSLSITYRSSSVAVDVVVFDKPARYRLVLEQKQGAWILRRV